MKIKLGEGTRNREILIELLNARGIGVSEFASVAFAARDAQLPDDGVVIVYDPDDIDGLIRAIDSLKESNGSTEKEHIIGKKKEKYAVIPVSGVLYFEAFGNTVYCKTPQERFEVNKKLYEIEKEFSCVHIIRINKSYAVNIRWIDEIIPWFGGRLVLRFRETGEKLEVSRKYVRSFKNQLGM